MRDSYDYVIVGAGVAAARAIEGIRQHDQTGTIGVFGTEATPPIYRPDLSKTLWLESDHKLEQSYLLPDNLGAEFFFSTEVKAIDPVKHRVTVENQEVGYRKLILATGSEPLTLSTSLGERILTYREPADFQKLHELAQPGAHIIVIGGGYIGAELASALNQNETSVTMVMPEKYVQHRLFPADLSHRITKEFIDRGVHIVNGRFAKAESDGKRVTVTLEDQTTIDGHGLVLGVGVKPRTKLAEDAGLTVDNGIVVDEYLQTSAADVYAVGDVASYPDALLGRRRVEHIDNAETMGKTVGATATGHATKYTHTPFFWSDLFDDGYEAVGLLDSRLHTFIDWNDDQTSAVIYYLEEGQVKGVLLWNTWDSVPAATEVIRQTHDAPVENLGELVGRITVG